MQGRAMLARALSSCGRLLGLWQPARPAEEERRAFGRLACEVETTCQPVGREPDGAFVARVKNVSRGGLCLTAARPARPGGLLSVSLPARAGEGPPEVLACVVRCDETSADRWELGYTFATPLSGDDLERFAPADARIEKRGQPRFDCAAQVTYQVVNSPRPAAAATVLNISGGGVALRVREPLAVGDLLSVELRREGVAPLTALASVVRTAVEADGERVVGCNFIHELPEEQIARLLA